MHLDKQPCQAVHLSESARTAGNTALGIIDAAMGVGITLKMAFGERFLTWIGIN